VSQLASTVPKIAAPNVPPIDRKKVADDVATPVAGKRTPHGQHDDPHDQSDPDAEG
jgi:hypothetical protein